MTKKILLVFFVIFIICSFPQICNAKDKIPTGNASEATIKKWITNPKNKTELKKISIEKYISWYNVTKKNSVAQLAVLNAIEENKDADQIKEFVYKKAEVKDVKPKDKYEVVVDKYIDPDKLKDVPEEILRVFWRVVGKAGDTVTERIIKKAVDPENKDPEEYVNPLLDPTDSENRAEYSPGLRTIESEKIKGITGPIITIVSSFGIIISVITLMIIGIKYMLGSAEQRADYKKTLFPYVIGAVLLFAGSTIPQIIYKSIVYSNL